MQFRKFVFMGAPGVGKGTFAKIICARYNLEHVSIGDILRKASQAENIWDTNSIGYMISKGILIPDATVHDLLVKTLKGVHPRGYIIDGFPRTLNQAKLLLEDNLVDRVVNITLDEKVSVAKMLQRKQCKTCGGDFNYAHIVEGRFKMPAILPDKETCILGPGRCDAIMVNRSDDDEVTIVSRLASHAANIQDISVCFDHVQTTTKDGDSTPLLSTFDVATGMADVDDLIDHMNS